jgi:hypothetical protein
MALKALLAAAAVAVWCAPQAAHAGIFDDAEVVDASEMEDMRGGFIVADGITIDFGAVVRTYVDGALALETQLTWTPEGPLTTQTVGDLGEPLADVDPAALAALGLEGVTGDDGIVLTNETGATALVHQVAAGEFQNFVFNSASGVAIRQEIDLSIRLIDFDAVQAGILFDRLGMRLSDEISSALYRFP